MVGNRRYSFAAFLLPNLFLYAQASGVAMLGVQCAVIVFLVVLLAIAFKPDPAAPSRNPAAVLAVALPVQVGAYFLLWMLGFGVELGWTVSGTHPLNTPEPPKGGHVEADRAEGKDMLLIGIEGSRDPEAALWREQVALSDVYTRYPLRNLPTRNTLTNLAPMEFDDDESNIRWVFSHDRMRFVGYGLLDQRARGELGVGEAQAAFPAPTMAFGAVYLFNAHAAYQYDSEQQRVFERIRLPQGEVMASPPEPAGDNIARAQRPRRLFLSRSRGDQWTGPAAAADARADAGPDRPPQQDGPDRTAGRLPDFVHLHLGRVERGIAASVPAGGARGRQRQGAGSRAPCDQPSTCRWPTARGCGGCRRCCARCAWARRTCSQQTIR